VVALEIGYHVRQFIYDQEDRCFLFANLIEKSVAILPPVVLPIRISFSQPYLESGDPEFGYFVQRVREQFPALRQALDDLGILIVQGVEKRLKEIGGMSEILDVLVDHREAVLGKIAQVIHHAGLE